MVIFILILLVFVITDEPLCLVVSNPIAVWFFSMFFKTNSDPILGCKKFFFFEFSDAKILQTVKYHALLLWKGNTSFSKFSLLLRILIWNYVFIVPCF